jgi:hypothetical protein
MVGMHRTVLCAIIYLWERAQSEGREGHERSISRRGTRAEMERTLVQRSLEDESFRQKLLDDPRGTVEQELGTQLPEGIEVRVVEESAQSIYLVLPSASLLGGEEGELSDQDLEAVAGGIESSDLRLRSARTG